jgi:hypothetical protein
MIVSKQQTPSTTLFVQPADIQRIGRALRRYALLSKYSHGTIKRQAMAMINIYIRQSVRPAVGHPHDWHAVM